MKLDQMKLPLAAHRVRGAWIIEDAIGAQVAILATVGGDDDVAIEADARTFVLDVNMHDDLLEICTLLVAASNENDDIDFWSKAQKAIDKARAVLAEMEATE